MKYKTKTLLQARKNRFSNEVIIDKQNLYLAKAEEKEPKKEQRVSSR